MRLSLKQNTGDTIQGAKGTLPVRGGQSCASAVSSLTAQFLWADDSLDLS